jgi:hypothetical protein
MTTGAHYASEQQDRTTATHDTVSKGQPFDIEPFTDRNSSHDDIYTHRSRERNRNGKPTGCNILTIAFLHIPSSIYQELSTLARLSGHRKLLFVFRIYIYIDHSIFCVFFLLLFSAFRSYCVLFVHGSVSGKHEIGHTGRGRRRHGLFEG